VASLSACACSCTRRMSLTRGQLLLPSASEAAALFDARADVLACRRLSSSSCSLLLVLSWMSWSISSSSVLVGLDAPRRLNSKRSTGTCVSHSLKSRAQVSGPLVGRLKQPWEWTYCTHTKVVLAAWAHIGPAVPTGLVCGDSLATLHCQLAGLIIITPCALSSPVAMGDMGR